MPDSAIAMNLSDLEAKPSDGQIRAAGTSRISASSGSSPALSLEAYRRRYAGLPGWQGIVLPKICRYAQFAQGWDSYGGSPLKLETGMFALMILNSIMTPRTPLPDIIPVGSGGVQIEWHAPDLDLELYVAAPYECELWFDDRRSGTSETHEMTTDFSPLQTQVAKLPLA